MTFQDNEKTKMKKQQYKLYYQEHANDSIMSDNLSMESSNQNIILLFYIIFSNTSYNILRCIEEQDKYWHDGSNYTKISKNKPVKLLTAL